MPIVVLGSQGIVVKRIVAIFFLTVDRRLANFINQLKMGGGGGEGEEVHDSALRNDF